MRIGDEPFTTQLDLVVEPSCGIEPEIVTSSLQPISLVQGVPLVDLVSFDPNSGSLTVKRTTNIELFSKIVSFKLNVETETYKDAIETLVTVSYGTAK